MVGNAGVEGVQQRLNSMRNFVQQQINTLTAKQVSAVLCYPGSATPACTANANSQQQSQSMLYHTWTSSNE
jgi:hypothetical protein